MTNIWKCKVGESGDVPMGGDAPMRQAISDAYYKLTGVVPDFIFSGWSAQLTEFERAVVEDREPLRPMESQPVVSPTPDAARELAAALREAITRLEHYSPIDYDYFKRDCYALLKRPDIAALLRGEQG